jgi:hypothetical protein
VVDESAAVPGLPGTPAQVVLQQRERAGEAGELHQGAIDDGRDVRPDDPGPSPGEEDATHDEADEQQMDDHHKVRASLEPHLVTCPDTTAIQHRPDGKVGQPRWRIVPVMGVGAGRSRSR